MTPANIQTLWPDGGQELAFAGVVALGLIVLLLAVHVVGSWRR